MDSDKVERPAYLLRQHDLEQELVNINFASIVGKEADHLLTMSDQYMASLYPAESNHLVSSESLRAGDAIFLGAFVPFDPPKIHATKMGGRLPDDDLGKCIGCAAARFYRASSYAEIKRLYVDEIYRGLGVARALMQAIEAEVAAEGIECARLEMGIYQPEAESLYRSLGYREIQPFGDYLCDPLSQFLEKIPLTACLNLQNSPQ